MSFQQRSHLVASICLLSLLAACSGGGGGAGPVTTANNSAGGTNTGSNGSTNTGSNGTTGTGSTGTGTTGTGTTGSDTTGTGSTGTGTTGTGGVTANVSITGAGAPTLGGAAFATENGATPNFTTSPPAGGTGFALMITGRQVAEKKINDAGISGGTLTFTGTTTNGLPGVQLKIPSIGVDATGVLGSSSSATMADGSRVTFSSGPIAQMTYTALGTWTDFAASGISGYDGAFLTGYQTQAGHVPTSGSATYLGVGSPTATSKTGGVSGQVWVPSGGGNPIQGGGVSGNATLNVNFATGAVDGQLSNMQVGGNAVGSLPWNTINLSGSLSGSGVSGTTSTSGPPAAAPAYFPQGFSSAATGTFKGALFGPNANEVGAVWTLSESTPEGGKSAVGVFGGTKQ